MPKGVYIHKKHRVFSDEHKRKISEALKGRLFTEEVRSKMSSSHLGKVMTEVQKEKIRISMLGKNEGKKVSEGPRVKQSGNRLGKKATLETRNKITQSIKGKKHTEETKEKIRKYFTGRKRPDLVGERNPMHTHPNAYKSRFGKTGFRKDLGIFLKSTWEANVMRIYKFLGYTIHYEPKSFKLSDGRTYRPDFYVEDLNLWIEVKGRWLKDARQRFLLFKKDYPQLNIQVINSVKYKEMFDKFKHKIDLEGH